MTDRVHNLIASVVAFVLLLTSVAHVALASAADSEFTRRVEEIDDALQTDFARAESLAVSYLADARRHARSDPLEVSIFLGRLVAAYNANGKQDDETLALAREVVAVQDSLPGVELEERSKSRRTLADLHRRRRECEDALRESRLGLEIIRQEVVDAPFEPPFLAIIGSCLRLSGDWEASIAAYEEAIAIEKRTHPEPTTQLGALLTNLANVHTQRGDFSAGQRNYHESIVILETLDDASSKTQLARVHRNIAVAQYRQGLNAEAIQHLDRALTIQREILRPDHPNIAATLNTISLNAISLSDYARALDAGTKAFEIYRSNGDSQFYGQIKTLFTLSSIAGRTGDLDDYEQKLGEIEEIFAEHEPSKPLEASYERRLGVLRAKQNRMEEAIEHLQTALELATGPDGNKVEAHWAQIYLAMSYQHAGEYELARDLWVERIEESKRTEGENTTSFEHYYLALAHLGLGEPDLALPLALASDLQVYARMRGQAAGLPEATALGLVSQKYRGLDLAVGLIDDVSQDAVAEVWSRVVLTRGVVYEELASRARGLVLTEDPALSGVAEELRSVREQLATATMRGPGRVGLDAHLAELDLMSAKKESLEVVLTGSGAWTPDPSRAEIDGGQIRASLPEGSALVSYLRYFEHENYVASDPAYIAFVVTADGCESIPLGLADQIDPAIERWWNQAAFGGGGDRGLTEVSTSHAGTYVEAAELVRHFLWDPVGEAIGDANLVFIVPDGHIHHVSFPSLPAGDGSYLLESGPIFHTLSAERDLVPDKEGMEVAGRGLLALGGADFEGEQSVRSEQFRGKTSSCQGFADLQFGYLAGSSLEVRELGDLWAERAAGADASMVSVFEGAEASEARFKKMAAGHRVLHLATHGFFLGGECLPPLGPRGSAFEVDDQQVLRENPLLLSGLALAGANRRNEVAGENEDGVLTAEEIAALDLRGVEWAVLSACETGAGTVQSGEGVLGLRRAFALAGAQTVIMSLWPVEDASTREWMNALYGARLDGANTARSVRDASLDVLTARRKRGDSDHPFYWSSFVAAGSWR